LTLQTSGDTSSPIRCSGGHHIDLEVCSCG